MRRIVALIVSAAAVLGLTAPQASAAPLDFPDPKGDANGLSGGTAAGSEPTLDIVGGRVSADGTTFRFAMVLDSTAPVAPSGGAFIFHFTYDEVHYYWNVYRDTLTFEQNDIFFHSSAEEATGPSPTCGGCKAVVDSKAKTVTVVAPLTGLNRGIKEMDKSAKPLGRGQALTGLRLEAMRNVVERERQDLPEDTASAGDKRFTF